MTRDEFIEGYTARSGMTRERFDRLLLALPCTCGEGGCEGWAAVSRTFAGIRHHLRHERCLADLRETVATLPAMPEGTIEWPLPTDDERAAFKEITRDAKPYEEGETLFG